MCFWYIAYNEYVCWCTRQFGKVYFPQMRLSLGNSTGEAWRPDHPFVDFKNHGDVYGLVVLNRMKSHSQLRLFGIPNTAEHADQQLSLFPSYVACFNEVVFDQDCV